MAAPRLGIPASMKNSVLAVFAGSLLLSGFAALDPALAAGEEGLARPDWLVERVDRPVELKVDQPRHELVLENGLLSRTFRTAPNFATVGYRNLSTGLPVIRAVKPEAVLVLDGRRYEIGGLHGQPDLAYLLPEWLEAMTADPRAFQFSGYTTREPRARFAWKRSRRSQELPWPPRGLELVAEFHPPAEAAERYRGLTISIHYEMLEGLPVLVKWFTVENRAIREVVLQSFTGEVLAAVEAEAEVESPVPQLERPRIHLQSDYSFNGFGLKKANLTTAWVADEEFKTQINFRLDAPVLLLSRPPVGPDALLKPGDSFESFRTFELLHDSDDRERKGLAVRRMIRAVAPWVTENPILMHARSADSAALRLAIDQCAEVGFEMVILTFGSGLNMESEDPDYRKKIKADVEYARQKGIELGGYSLLSSRGEGPEVSVIDARTGKPGGAYFGQAPCLATEWGDRYFRRILGFLDATGMSVFENDGPYPGDRCGSTRHLHHRGLGDSQWTQWRAMTRFYQECRARGVYLNAPDWYFLNGTNKTGMGYRETNWSLPRERQILLARQNIFDGTWEKTPTMGWMFVPLVEYQGGGEPATLEPLSKHLDAYRWHLAQNFGSGVQACYRGPRLYDTEETRALVKEWVDFFKRHRDILESDIIHVRRPDGVDLDCMLHVNPRIREKGLAMVYNPTGREIERPLALPLYYSGLTDTARIREREGTPREYPLDRRWEVQLQVKLPARSFTWFVVE
jgi:hypothetical protein